MSQCGPERLWAVSLIGSVDSDPRLDCLRRPDLTHGQVEFWRREVRARHDLLNALTAKTAETHADLGGAHSVMHDRDHRRQTSGHLTSRARSTKISHMTSRSYPLICTTDACGEGLRKRGMCSAHYQRWRRRTSPDQRAQPTTEERFWAKVNKTDGCWEWAAAKRSSGHGWFATPAYGAVSAHRYSLELALGRPPVDGEIACHHCDNPPCVRPDHLYYGTHQTNADDAWARDRMPVESQRAAAILHEQQVVDLRNAYAAGGNTKLLAAEYGISVSSLRQIVLGLKWRQVGGPITRRCPRVARKAA